MLMLNQENDDIHFKYRCLTTVYLPLVAVIFICWKFFICNLYAAHESLYMLFIYCFITLYLSVMFMYIILCLLKGIV